MTHKTNFSGPGNAAANHSEPLQINARAVFLSEVTNCFLQAPKSSQMIKHSVSFVCYKHLVSWKQICYRREDDHSQKRVQGCFQLVSSVSVSVQGCVPALHFHGLESVFGVLYPVKFGD